MFGHSAPATRLLLRIQARQFREADAARIEVERLTRKMRCWLPRAPLQGQARAAEKVREDYGGDWMDIKDIARMTIIMPTLDECVGMIRKLEDEFAAAKGRGVVQVKRGRKPTRIRAATPG